MESSFMLLLYVWSVLQSSWSSSRRRNLLKACWSFSSHSAGSLTGTWEWPQWCCWDWGWCWTERVAWPSRSPFPFTLEHLPGESVPAYALGPREGEAGLEEGVLKAGNTPHYKTLDENFVGHILSVFNYNTYTGIDNMKVAAFQSVKGEEGMILAGISLLV